MLLTLSLSLSFLSLTPLSHHTPLPLSLSLSHRLTGGVAAKDIDGISILPTLMGKPQADKEYLYWTWSGTGMLGDLPAGWTTHQDSDGLAVYEERATGRVTAVRRVVLLLSERGEKERERARNSTSSFHHHIFCTFFFSFSTTSGTPGRRWRCQEGQTAGLLGPHRRVEGCRPALRRSRCEAAFGRRRGSDAGVPPPL